MHQVVIIIHPEPLQLAQDRVGLEALEVPDLHIRHPEVLEDGQVQCSQRLHLIACKARLKPSQITLDWKFTQQGSSLTTLSLKSEMFLSISLNILLNPQTSQNNLSTKTDVPHIFELYCSQL